jgi:hypothetical protein
MSAYIPLVCAIFGIFLAIILVVTFPVSCCSSQKEGFQDTNTINIKCPRGTKTYTTLSGDTMCCKGSVEGNKCEGKVLCTLSENSTDKVPTCAELRRQYLAKLQMKCPANAGFTSYEDDDTGNKGCAAQTTAERSQPQTPATNFCRLYDDKIDNENYPDSCQNYGKSLEFNTAFMNSARPNFCLDVDTAKTFQDAFTIGMAPCSGSDGQAFKIDEKGHVISKKGGILWFYYKIYLFKNQEFIKKILSESEPKFQYYGRSKITKVPTQNGGFKITNLSMNAEINSTMYYGLYDTSVKNSEGVYSYLTNNTKNEDISVVGWYNNYNETQGAIEWSATPVTTIKKPMTNTAPQGYYWQCNLNKY